VLFYRLTKRPSCIISISNHQVKKEYGSIKGSFIHALQEIAAKEISSGIIYASKQNKLFFVGVKKEVQQQVRNAWFNG
jgi:hypothetical protein